MFEPSVLTFMSESEGEEGVQMVVQLSLKGFETATRVLRKWIQVRIMMRKSHCSVPGEYKGAMIKMK